MEDNPTINGERRPLLGSGSDEEELTGCGKSICCDPHRALHRYLVLIIMCFLSFGSYFCFDNPAALVDTMKSDLDISTATFMNFYAFYSWPNVILCFFGGFLLDRVFGIRLGTIIFSVFVLAGQLIFAAGALVNKIWLMDAGRFVFGVGGESLAVAQNTYAVNWFKGKELNMVFGLQISFSRVGSTVNMNVMKPIYNYVHEFYTGNTCLGIVLFIAALTCVLSMVCALAMAYFDKRANRILKTEQLGTGEVIHLSDVKDFSALVWILCVICVAYYVAVFPFIGLGKVFFMMKYNMSPSDASIINSLIYVLSAVMSPLFGLCIDKTGRNVFWVIGGTVLTLACHATLAFTFINPYVPIVIMGLALSVVASALWPMVALVVPVHQLGTAYGLMQSIQNLGLALVAMAAGVIVDSYGYLMLEVFFLAWLCLALLACAVLYLVDSSRGGEVNFSAAQRRALEKRIEMSIEEESRRGDDVSDDVTGSHDEDVLGNEDFPRLHPRSDFAIRNRYLSRIGQQLPDHYAIKRSALAHHGILK